ncbi:hypothetical protein [Candidatus Uabimicrobium sp. HlEnr_7]|uniref:hypothetical protein n=1 Tax=Candidatus Uabimicrobium helgolandensis TaxID=3095367 RepID=UPI0035562E5C
MYKSGLLLIIFILSGCAHNYYNAGGNLGDIPQSDCNINLLLFGARWGNGTRVIAEDGSTSLRGRTSIWSPLFDYENFDNNTKLKLLGPALPNLFGYLNVDGQKGIVTPLYSQHSGHLNSWCIGPIFFPIFRMDYADDGYQSYTVLGLIQFGSFGVSLPFLHAGTSPRPLYVEGHHDQHKRGQILEVWEGRWAAGY